MTDEEQPPDELPAIPWWFDEPGAAQALRETRMDGERPTPRCLDCWRPDGDEVDGHEVNVEKRETWSYYPEHRGERYTKPRYCDRCWLERVAVAPKLPKRLQPPSYDGHEPVNRGERCLSCGEPGIVPIGTQGSDRSKGVGVVVYRCPSCGEDKMDDWALEDYRWDAAAEEAVPS